MGSANDFWWFSLGHDSLIEVHQVPTSGREVFIDLTEQPI